MKAKRYKKYKKGTIVNVLMKPVLLREWEIVKYTPKSLLVKKTFKGGYRRTSQHHIPKKSIMRIEKVKGKPSENIEELTERLGFKIIKR